MQYDSLSWREGACDKRQTCATICVVVIILPWKCTDAPTYLQSVGKLLVQWHMQVFVSRRAVNWYWSRAAPYWIESVSNRSIFYWIGPDRISAETWIVHSLPKIALRAAKLPTFKTINRKPWSPRTIPVIDLCPRSMLTWFCACVVYVVFNIRPYTILRDNSIYLNRTAVQVVQ